MTFLAILLCMILAWMSGIGIGLIALWVWGKFIPTPMTRKEDFDRI